MRRPTISYPCRSRPTTDPRARLALRIGLGLWLAASLVACSAMSGLLGEGTVAKLGPAFDHKGHLDRGPECTDCHEGAEDEDEAGMPDVEVCTDCHDEFDEKQPPEKRITAFLDADGEPQWSNVTELGPEFPFSHTDHDDADVACEECHVGIEESERVTADLRVDMDGCIACHAERNAPNDCEGCHPSVGRDWKPANHDRMWMTLHGQVTRRNSPRDLTEECSLCHTQSACASCHRSMPPRDHSESWRVGGGHGLASRMDRDRCQACHEVHSCIRCHEDNPPRSHRATWGGRRSHHCLSCHIPLRPNEPGGCGVCHRGTPSHSLAPQKPSWHRPDMECLQCHAPLRHADNGQNCNICHR